MITVVVLDMAGTTVHDGGTVDAAFSAALGDCGLEPGSPGRQDADRIVTETMGQSKLEVFTRILGPGRAGTANAAFEKTYLASVAAGEVTALPGAARVLEELREAGVRSCLTTGFSVETRNAVLDALGWWDLVDLALCPSEVGRGRPWPDLVWAAMLRLRAGSVAEVLVAGDTPSDVRSGLAAGAGSVVGVLSGAGTASALEAAGAHRLLSDVSGVPGLISAHR